MAGHQDCVSPSWYRPVNQHSGCITQPMGNPHFSPTCPKVILTHAVKCFARILTPYVQTSQMCQSNNLGKDGVEFARHNLFLLNSGLWESVTSFPTAFPWLVFCWGTVSSTLISGFYDLHRPPSFLLLSVPQGTSRTTSNVVIPDSDLQLML